MEKDVLEIEDRMGVFTVGKVKDVYEAHEMFLDWFFEHQCNKNSRNYFREYWSVSEEMLGVEHIQECEMMRCGECYAWSLDDDDCFQCEDKRLDHRTKQRTFNIQW